MYKYLIIGMAFIFIYSGGYYMYKAGGELLINAFSSGPQKGFTPPTQESVTGVYICDTRSGCDSKYVLLLKDDQTVEMLLVSPEDGETVGGTESTENTDDQNTQPVERNSIIVNDTIPSPENYDSTENVELVASSSETVDVNTGETATTTENQEVAAESQENILSLDELVTSSTSIVDKGNWDLGVQNMLVITLKEQGTTTYEVPQKLVVKNVGASTLSRISYTKSMYKDMIKPVFVKQDY